MADEDLIEAEGSIAFGSTINFSHVNTAGRVKYVAHE